MKRISVILSLILLFSTSFTVGAQSMLSALFKTAQALTVSDSQMASYAKQTVASMDSSNEIAAANSPYMVRLKRLTSKLRTADGIPLNFKVYLVKDVNAFACPDGSVRVYSALMDLMSDDELLGVIGHEIGHVAKHHSKKQFKQQLMNSAAREALAAYGGTIGTLSAGLLGSLGETLMSAKYSQKQEKEADDYGYDFLKKNGYNPWGMAMAFEKLQSMEGSSKSNYVQRLFSSHPDTQTRIKRMTDRAKKDGFARPAK